MANHHVWAIDGHFFVRLFGYDALTQKTRQPHITTTMRISQMIKRSLLRRHCFIVLLALLTSACASTASVNNDEIQMKIKDLGSESTREEAYGEIYSLGAPALPYLADAIASDPNVMVRRHAAILAFGMLSLDQRTISQVRASPNTIPPLVDKLIVAMADPDQEVRAMIPRLVQGLSLFAGHEIFTQKILPQLEQASRSDNELIRIGADQSLKKLPSHLLQKGSAENDFLIGEWSGTSKEGSTVTYKFEPNGMLTWDVNEASFRQNAPFGLRAKYTIRKRDGLWEIDIYDFDSPQLKDYEFKGIIRPMLEGRFDMEPPSPDSLERPQSFTDNAIIFIKK